MKVTIQQIEQISLECPMAARQAADDFLEEQGYDRVIRSGPKQIDLGRVDPTTYHVIAQKTISTTEVKEVETPEWQEGALRGAVDGGMLWLCANPQDVIFSTVTMIATQVRRNGRWENIFGENT